MTSFCHRRDRRSMPPHGHSLAAPSPAFFNPDAPAGCAGSFEVGLETGGSTKLYSRPSHSIAWSSNPCGTCT